MIPSLERLCIKAVQESWFWKVQKRQLEHLPEHAANEIFIALFEQGALDAISLEMFQHCVTEAYLNGNAVRSDWLAYLGRFLYLEGLQLEACLKLQDDSLSRLLPLNGTLSHLSLKGCRGLSGKASYHLQRLTSLTYLSLEGTCMGPPTAQRISALPQLSHLNLACSPVTADCTRALASALSLQTLSLSGCDIGDGEVQLLAASTSIRSLDLTWTRVTAPPLMASLTFLSLDSCYLGSSDHANHIVPHEASHSVRQQGGCPVVQSDRGVALQGSLQQGCLQHLELQGLQLDPTAWLRGAHGLLSLNLAGTPTPATSLGTLSKLTALTSLNLQVVTSLSNEVAWHLTSLGRLQHLNLAGCPGLNDASLPALWALTALTHLQLSSTGIAGLPGMGLPNSSSPVSTAESPSWASLEQLQCLELDDTRIGRLGCRALQPLRGHLTSLHIGGLSVDDMACEATARQGTSLKCLRLHGSLITQRGLIALKALWSLEELRIQGCAFMGTSARISLVSELPQLKCLHWDGVVQSLTELRAPMDSESQQARHSHAAVGPSASESLKLARFEERIKYMPARLQLLRKQFEADNDCQQIAATLRQLLPAELIVP
ncbi:hypothetical protein WJX74_000325 [Apatococcus lobatus]|uniref:Uncharacterized protein n=1 Tax=Apatococcus lobatus TaxID=904363 RepID=A0AAW1QLR8_9CHLO